MRWVVNILEVRYQYIDTQHNNMKKWEKMGNSQLNEVTMRIL